MNVRTCMLLAWLGTRLLVSGADNLPETNAPPATLATNSTALVPLSAAANVAPPTAATPAVAKATPENVPSVPATTANLLPEYYHLNTEAASWMGLILGVAAMFSVTVIICCWLLVRRRVPPVAPASGNNLPVPTAQILPLITTTVKETLANELAVQRRELLVSQQSATSDLAHLAHRLEALQSQALERSRHHPLRLPDPHREVPVKIFCECGQKYSFEVHPVDGQMPFAVTCPACEEDGTDQANHFLARLLNSVTQPLPRISYRGWIPGAMPEKMAQGTPSSPEVNGHSEALNGNDPAKPIPTAECVTSLLATAIHLLETGRAEEAIKCYETALVLQPAHPDALVKLGTAWDKAGRPEEALRYYDQAIQADAAQTVAYLLKGGLLNRLTRHEEAALCYEQALLKQKKNGA